MSTKQNKSSSLSFRLIKWAMIFLLIAAITWPTLKIIAVFFGKVDPKLRARIFMVYRTKCADPFMLNGRYKFIKPNAYPTDEKREAFNKIAQDEKEGVLTKYPYPEHFAREPEWNFTLCDKVYYLLWNVRVKVCDFLEDNKQKDTLDLIRLPKEAKVDKFFRQYPEMTNEQYKELFTNVDKKGKGWGNAAVTFIDLLLNIIEKPEEYKVEDSTVSSKLEADILTFAGKLGYDKAKLKKIKPQIPEFFIKYGEAYPTVFHSTIYSRCFYFFVFLTINGEFDYSDIKVTKDMKMEEYNKETMTVLTSVFAQTFAKVYPEAWDYEMEETTYADKFVKWFGPSQNIKGIKKQDKNIKIVQDLLKKNRAILASA